MASKVEGSLGKLAVGFKGEVPSAQRVFHPASFFVEQYFSQHLESAKILSVTVSQSLLSEAGTARGAEKLTSTRS